MCMCNTMAPPTLSGINFGTEQSKTDWAEEKRERGAEKGKQKRRNKEGNRKSYINYLFSNLLTF